MFAQERQERSGFETPPVVPNFGPWEATESRHTCKVIQAGAIPARSTGAAPASGL